MRAAALPCPAFHVAFISGSGVDEKGLTWRRNYLARLRNVGYRHDEFASDKANPV